MMQTKHWNKSINVIEIGIHDYYYEFYKMNRLMIQEYSLPNYQTRTEYKC